MTSSVTQTPGLRFINASDARAEIPLIYNPTTGDYDLATSSDGLLNVATFVWNTGTLSWDKATQAGGGGGGGAATIAAFTADCPYPTVDQVFNVIDASVTGASKVLVSTGHYTDLDTNSPEDIDWNVESVAAGSFNFRIRSKNNEVVGGPYKFFYMLG